MKNHKLFLSVFLILLMLMSATPAFAVSQPIVALVSPAATSIPAVTTAAAFTVDSAVSPYANIVFTLQFGGISNIYDVDTSNIKFYKATETAASAAAITISGTNLDTTNSRYYATNTAPVTVTVNAANLTADTDYVLYLSSAGIGNKNNDNNLAKDVYYYISTNHSAAPDTTPPYWSSGSIDSLKTNNSITLSWNAATDDNAGVSYYKVEQNDGTATTAVTTAALTYTATGLSAGKNYTYSVTAFDVAGNESTDELILTENVNFEAAFLGRSAGIGINSSLHVLLEGTAESASFAAITTKSELVTTGAGITPQNVPVTVTLTNGNQVVSVDPAGALAYGTEYALTLSDQIVRTDGALISGTRSFEFRTIDLAAPTVQTVNSTTSAAAVTLTAGQSYTVTITLQNDQDAAVSGKVMFVTRSGKGTILEYGGDSTMQKQNITVNADGSTSVAFTYTVPTDDSETVYFDIYTMNAGESEFLSSPVHKAFTVE